MSENLNKEEFLSDNEPKSGLNYIDSVFSERFDLKKLIKYIESDFDVMRNGIKINSYESLVDYIIDNADHSIKVGVGGLYINEFNEVLLYRRDKAPEKDKWSIIGGRGVKFDSIQDTLLNKFSKITQIDKDDILIGDVIRVNNHYDKKKKDFHYVSPSFYVEIRNIDDYLIRETESDLSYEKKVVYEFNSDGFKNKYSTIDNYVLSWVPISVILNKDYRGLFTSTTLNAIKSHIALSDNINHIVGHINSYSRLKFEKLL